MIGEFKFFKGQLIKPKFLSENRNRLPLSDRWSWIDRPTIQIMHYDYDTGDTIVNTHNVRQFYCTFNEFIGDIILDSRMFYIFNMTLIENNQNYEIPTGTAFNEMGIYDWSSIFRIRAIVI